MKTEEQSEAEHLDKVRQALREVAQRHGMADAHLNPHEGLGLELHDGQEICLEYAADRHKLFIYTPLTALVPDTLKRQAMLEAALQMNCLESGAAGALVALDAHGKTLLLQTALETADLNAERLERALNQLLQQRGVVLQGLTEAAGRTAGSHTHGRRGLDLPAWAIPGGKHGLQD